MSPVAGPKLLAIVQLEGAAHLSCWSLRKEKPVLTIARGNIRGVVLNVRFSICSVF